MSLKKQALNGFVWSILDKLIGQLGYLGVTIFIARLIGPESYGLIGMLAIFVLLSESIVSNGFSDALIQRSHHLTEDDASTIFYVNLAWGIIMYLLLYFSAPLIADFYNEPRLVDVSRFLFIIILLNSLSVVARAKLTIVVDFKSQAFASMFATLLSSLVGIYLALEGYGYWALVWLQISKSFFSFLGFWFFCRWIPKLLFNFDSFKRLFGFGSNLMLAGLMATFTSNLYILLIGRYFNVVKVGYFSQAANLSHYLSYFVSASLQVVTYPIMTSVKEDRKRLVNIYTQLISITMFVSLPLLVGFSAVSEEFIRLVLGDEWLPVAPILSIFCLARAISPISAINKNILNTIGRSDLFLRVDLVKFPIVLVSLFIAMPYGIQGIAWAIFITTFIAFFIDAYYPWKIFQFGGIKQLKIAYKYIIAVIIMYLSVSLVSGCENTWLLLLKKILIGIFVYLALVFILRDKFILDKFKSAVGAINTRLLR